jgi:hypothetical protein
VKVSDIIFSQDAGQIHALGKYFQGQQITSPFVLTLKIPTHGSSQK